MTLRIVRLGTPRAPHEGLRIGAVRRPPRGVKKEDFAKRDFYDLWLPALSPSAALVKQALDAQKSGDERTRKAFVRAYRAEMKEPAASGLLDVLAALSKQTDFSIGCYCADEARCHRSVLRTLFEERGAAIG